MKLNQIIIEVSRRQFLQGTLGVVASLGLPREVLSSSNWTQMATVIGFIVYGNLDTITSSDNTKQIWLKHIWKAPAQAGHITGERDGPRGPVTGVLERVAYDCVNRTASIRVRYMLDERGEPYPLKDNQSTKVFDIQPDTYHDQIIDKICRSDRLKRNK